MSAERVVFYRLVTAGGFASSENLMKSASHSKMMPFPSKTSEIAFSNSAAEYFPHA